MTRLLIQGIGGCVALTTVILAALFFRSEAQLQLEEQHASRGQPPASPQVTALLIDQQRIERYGQLQIYFDPGEAAHLFRQALKAAPLDIHTWSRYSVAQFYAGNLEAANRAAQHTLALSSTDAAVGMEQALLAADFWEVATPATRELWWSNIENLMARDPLGLAQYADRTDRADRLCAIAAPESALATLCARRK